MKLKKNSPLITAFWYCVFGSMWIIFSDTLLSKFVSNISEYRHIETAKGLIFVLLSTLLIFLVSRYLHRKGEKLAVHVDQSKQAFQSLFEIAPVGYALIDTTGKIQMSNSYLESMLRLLDKNEYEFKQLIPEGQQEKFKNTLKKFADPDTTFIVSQQQFINRDGKIISGLLNISRINLDPNSNNQLLISLQDVTSENEMIQELSALTSELQEVRKEGNIGHWELDPEAMTVTLSEEVHEIFEPVKGIKTESVKNLLQILNDVESAKLERSLNEAIEHHTSLNATFEFMDPSKNENFFLLKGEFITSKKTGKPILSGIFRNVTTEVRYLREKQEMINKLGKWCTMLSHELRKPIVTFGGLTELLVQKDLNDPEIKRILTYFEYAFRELDEKTRKFSFELDEKQKNLSKSLFKDSLDKSANDYRGQAEVA